MGRFRATLSGDALDREVQGYLNSARRSVERAVDACRKAVTVPDRFRLRQAHRDLSSMRLSLDEVRSTVPARFEDPDLYPEQLRGSVANIQQQMRMANDALAKAKWHLNRAEESFTRAEASFLTEEIRQVERVQRDLKVVWVALGRYRGLGTIDLKDPLVVAVPESFVEETPMESPDIEYDEESG